MFFLQFISFRSMPQASQNPQMKMMMYFMPPFFGFIFMNFPSGLNLYYATANLATIPQQILIARERRAASKAGPIRIDRDKAKGYYTQVWDKVSADMPFVPLWYPNNMIVASTRVNNIKMKFH